MASLDLTAAVAPREESPARRAAPDGSEMRISRLFGTVRDKARRRYAHFETAPINHLVIAVHERLPRADRAKLLANILSWPTTAKGQAILAAGTWPGFVVAKDSEYQEIRRYRSRLRTLAHR